MEVDALDISEVAHEYPDGRVVLHYPQFGCPVVRAGGEVGAQRRELYLPDWVGVTVVNGQDGPGLQRPESDYYNI